MTRFGAAFLLVLFAAAFGAAAQLLRFDRARTVAPGVATNERLTALAGVPLFILLAAMAVTIFFVRQLLPVHYLVGFLLIPPLGLKLASAGYRFGRYYTRSPSYRLAGPPPVLLRLVASVLVISTGAVFVTGIELWLVGLRLGSAWVEAHTLSSVVMILSTGLHTLSHLRRSAAAAVEEITGPRLREAFTPRSLVVASLVLGAVLAAASLLYSTPFPPAGAGG